MKTLNRLLIIFVLLTCFTYMAGRVIAETIVETTPTATFFESKVMPYLISGGTGFGGSFLGFLGLIRTTKKKADDTAGVIKKKMDDAQGVYDELSKKVDAGVDKLVATEQTVQTQMANVGTDIKNFTAAADKAIADMKATTEEATAKLKKTTDETKSEVEALRAEILAIKASQTATAKAIVLGLGNNAQLVADGYAKEINALMAPTINNGEAAAVKQE